MSLKNPVTPPGIDPGTVRLVAQRLNHCATPGPIYIYIYIYIYTIYIYIIILKLESGYGHTYGGAEPTNTFQKAFCSARVGEAWGQSAKREEEMMPCNFNTCSVTMDR
jgi:hypothetical protein